MNLYHYCCNTAFLNIAKGGQLWLSELSLSNDYMEGRWLRTVIHQILLDRDIDMYAISNILQAFDEISICVGGTAFCLSEEPDLLSQWRGYGDDGAGMSIGFAKSYLEKLSELNAETGLAVCLQKVEYEHKKQKLLLDEIVGKCIDEVGRGALDSGFDSLLHRVPLEKKEQIKRAKSAITRNFISCMLYSYALKNPAFSEEKEWRLLSLVPQRHREDDAESWKEMSYRSTGDKIVPYIELPLVVPDENPFSHIVLGPKNRTPIRFVFGVLEKYGYHRTRVERSSASLQ